MYVGLRDLDRGERLLIHANNIKAFTMYHVDKYGIGKVMEMALDHLGQRPLHLSYDIDACDPGVRGGRERGGGEEEEERRRGDSKWRERKESLTSVRTHSLTHTHTHSLSLSHSHTHSHTHTLSSLTFTPPPFACPRQ